MIFIDASALIAILAGEPEEAALIATLAEDPDRTVSGLSRWEAIAGLAKSYGHTPDQATAMVEDFMHEFGVKLTAIGQRESDAAVLAYKTFGRGRHKAALNMGGCFAYACAKAQGASLLYKGGDFAFTDLA